MAKRASKAATRNQQPIQPCIPTVTIRREWPYYRDPEDEDRESLETVVNEIDSLWRLLSDPNLPLDDLEFFGPSTEYFAEVSGEPSEMLPRSGDARFAIANFRYLRESLCAELRRKCLREAGRTSLVHDVREMLSEYLSGDIDAVHVLWFQNDDCKSIRILETRRRDAVALVRSEMAKLQIWLSKKVHQTWTGAGSKTNGGTQRIPEEYLKEARKLFRLSPKTPKRTIMARLGCGSDMATRINEAMRKEGLCETKPRGRHAKN